MLHRVSNFLETKILLKGHQRSNDRIKPIMIYFEVFKDLMIFKTALIVEKSALNGRLMLRSQLF